LHKTDSYGSEPMSKCKSPLPTTILSITVAKYFSLEHRHFWDNQQIQTFCTKSCNPCKC